MSWTFIVKIKPVRVKSYLTIENEINWLEDNKIHQYKMRWMYEPSGDLYARFAFKRKRDAVYFQLACG